MQLPAPAIPTDNLYKFLAISGLVLLVICLLYPPMIVEETTARAANLRAAVTVMKHRVANARQDVDYTSDALAEGKKNPDLSDENLHEIEAENARNMKEARQLEIDVAELERDVVIADAAVRVSLNRMRLMSDLVYVAFGAMIIGFLLWYRRVQRHADAILKEQALALTRDRLKPAPDNPAGPVTQSEPDEES